jgi:hypothetical protein
MPGFETGNEKTDKSAESNGLSLASLTSTGSAAASWVGDTAVSAAGKVERIGLVTIEGLANAVPGVVKGAVHDFSREHWGETSVKFGTAAAMGVAIRVLLPEAGAAKAVVGTVLGGMFAYDAAKPFAQAYSSVWDDKTDMGAVHKAAQTFGDSFGQFAFDSAVGLAIAKYAEGKTPGMAKKLIGESRWNRFESWKTVKVYDAETGVIGRPLQRVADFNDRHFGDWSNKINPNKPGKQLSIEDQYREIAKVGQQVRKSFEDGGFYKRGPRTEDGGRVDFSKMIDALLEGKDPTEVATPAKPGWKLEVRKPDGEVKLPRTDAAPEVTSIAGKIERPSAVETRPVPEQLAKEYDADNILKLAKTSEKTMNKWDDRRNQIADEADRVAAPVHSISDATRSGSMLPPEYMHSRDQLMALAKELPSLSDQELANVLFVLRLHQMAGMQMELGNPIVVDFNNYSKTLSQIMADGMAKAGVSNKVVKESAPSLFALADDQGSGNFTLPIVDGALNRPVTLFPRNQTELASTFGGINLHEVMGHNKTFQELARFDQESRMELVTKAVSDAFANNPWMKDTVIEVPGIGNMKKSEFMRKALIAQANENTSDLMGTATGGADTGLTLAILLSALRSGNKLETRNVYGAEFENLLEPHGIDTFRLKVAGQTMRHLANGDPLTVAQGNALDNLAAKASVGGDNYVWASRDVKGKAVSIPMKEFDALIPEIVKLQFDHPLKSLEGRTFRQILPDLPTVVKKTDMLATLMAEAATTGRKELTVPFDNKEYTVVQVFSAGTQAWMKLTSAGMDAEAALARVTAISEGLRATYRTSNPHANGIAPQAIKFNSKFEFGPQARRAWGNTVEGTYSFSARMLARQRALRDFADHYALEGASAYATVAVGDLLEQRRMREEMEKKAQQK